MSQGGYSSSSDDDISDDVGSNVSDVSYTGTLLDVEERGAISTDSVTLLKDQLLESMDNISDKRKSTREHALKVFIKILSKTSKGSEMLEGREETVTFKLLNVVKRNKKNSDAILALKALELVAITFGASNQGMYDECVKVLFPMIKTSRKDAVRGAAIRAAAMICFVSTIEESSTIDCMGMFESVFRDAVRYLMDGDEDGDEDSSKKKRKTKKKNKTSFLGLTASLNGWGLLATTRSEKYLGTSAFKTITPLLNELLEHDSNEVRKAAGQNAALLAQYRFKIHHEEEDDEDEDKDEDKDEKELLDTIRSQLKALSIENSRYKSKRDMKAQRSFFRAVCGTLESGSAPEMKIVLRGEKVIFDSWTDVKRFEAFRTSLGGGISTYLQSDTVLRQVFDLGPVRVVSSADRLSKLEKRMYRSPNSELSKARTIDRARERGKKAAARNAVYSGGF